MNKCLLTGGSGNLGTELKKHFQFDAPTSNELDITKDIELDTNYDTVVHCAAYTDVSKAEQEKEKCYLTNVKGTENLLKRYKNSYFVYISSEYCFHPVNFYSYTKLWGEELVRKHPNHLIIRTLFKPNPFPYEYAFVDQFTAGDYLDIIAFMIYKEIFKGTKGTIHLGTGRKTMFELAKRSRPSVKGNSIKDMEVKIPGDYI